MAKGRHEVIHTLRDLQGKNLNSGKIQHSKRIQYATHTSRQAGTQDARSLYVYAKSHVFKQRHDLGHQTVHLGSVLEKQNGTVNET